jgi:hypothetical protein
MTTNYNLKRILPRAIIAIIVLLGVALLAANWRVVAAPAGTGPGGGEPSDPPYDPQVGPDGSPAFSVGAGPGESDGFAGSGVIYACGTFTLTSWGPKVVIFKDFPECIPPLTVMCINEGAWTDKFVEGVSTNTEQTALGFTAYQHGTCGLFHVEGGVPSDGVVGGN